MPALDPIAVRVARRHIARELAAQKPSTRATIGYGGCGRISAVELMKMLKPTTGPLVKLRFRASIVIDPNGVEFESLDENANIISGRLVLHAAVAEDEVVSWAEVIVDEPTSVGKRIAREVQRRPAGLETVGSREDCCAPDDQADCCRASSTAK